MTVIRFLLAIALASFCLTSPPGYGANATPDPGRPREFNTATLAKVVPGQTTKKQVEALLGQPWRTTFSDDPDEPGPVVWEYRGKDSNGVYRVHIEFNNHDVTTLIAKIPDSSGEAPARRAKTPSQPGKSPQKDGMRSN